MGKIHRKVVNSGSCVAGRQLEGLGGEDGDRKDILLAVNSFIIINFCIVQMLSNLKNRLQLKLWGENVHTSVCRSK